MQLSDRFFCIHTRSLYEFQAMRLEPTSFERTILVKSYRAILAFDNFLSPSIRNHSLESTKFSCHKWKRPNLKLLCYSHSLSSFGGGGGGKCNRLYLHLRVTFQVLIWLTFETFLLSSAKYSKHVFNFYLSTHTLRCVTYACFEDKY